MNTIFSIERRNFIVLFTLSMYALTGKYPEEATPEIIDLCEAMRNE